MFSTQSCEEIRTARADAPNQQLSILTTEIRSSGEHYVAAEVVRFTLLDVSDYRARSIPQANIIALLQASLLRH